MVYTDSLFSTQDQTTPEQVSSWVRSLGFAEDTEQSSLIHRAFILANAAHGGQTRASGEPYITHTMAVAEILVTLHLDPEAVAAAILHDVVEDTPVTIEQVEREFGKPVAKLVDGVTKLAFIEQKDLIERGTREHMHAESLRKLLLAMAEDVRVVLIKLADRLHNLRTLKYLPEEKQRRVARETMDIYAPLANRLGIWQIKWELEDLSFRYLEPADYKKVAAFLDERRVDRERYINNAIRIIRSEMNKIGINADISGRPKHIYSIWKKMHRKHVAFDAVYDVRAIRILVDKVQDCYAALGAIHTLWRHIPKEFDDYIATPKENMYQSIHTAVIGPEGKTLEIQIRTSDMHAHAELGVAAHWSYKEGAKADASYDQKIAWLRQLLDWKDESTDAGDFIDRFKSEVFQDRVYVITPQGDIIDLPQGATPLDFAYHIHTDVGHRCRGARIEGRIVNLTYELKSGEVVEVLTTKTGQPSRDWLNPQLGYLKTSRARAKVRAWFKQQDNDMNISVGREALEKDLRRLNLQNVNHKTLADQFKFQTVDEFYAAIGRGDITSTQIASRGQILSAPEPAVRDQIPVKRKVRKEHDDINIQGVGNLLTKLARCCSPAPGDSIIGYITQGRGVTIHRRDCRNILKMNGDSRGRLINVEWGEQVHETYPVDIGLETIDRQDLLRDILNVLSNEKININAVHTQSNKQDNTAHMEMSIEVASVAQLSRVLNRLGQLNNVLEVRRIRKS
ncbi:MAG: GTP diphosphokinase [Gammaproteobacteria bacterium]|nr:GTP diphosphokinase [Gammaproteobacteria bacterium]